MSINLSPRLRAAAALVRGDGTLADIGTDHAYLPAFLVLEGIVSYAIASDINKKPLENARETVEHFSLRDKISLRLSDGLKGYKKGEAVEFVFAGMGGTLISELLASCEWVKDENLHFIFQPQSRAEELREFLYKNGFEILKELALHEGRRYYIAFDAVYTGEIAEYTYADCFLGKLDKNSPDARRYIENQADRLRKKYEAQKQLENALEAQTLFEVIKALDNFSRGEL